MDWKMDLSQEAYEYVESLEVQLAEAQADNAKLISEFKQLLKYNSLAWLHDHFNDIVLFNHPGSALLKELEQLREGKAIYETYDGSKLDKADQYIERLEKELDQYKRALDMCLERWQHNHKPGFDYKYKDSQIAAMKKYLLAQAKAGEE